VLRPGGTGDDDGPPRARTGLPVLSAPPHRRIGWLLLAVLALVIVATITSVFWIRTASPVHSGEIAVDGVSADVHVWRDALGIPHIIAADESDLLFAQGFVHAQDRLWQMELLRRVAAGRLAEVLGPDLIDSDRFLRTIGMWRAAGDQERALDDDARARIGAYVAGINGFLSTRRGALPPEFLALGFQPEPWTVRHTLAIEKVMAWDLALYSSAAEQARSARLLGEDAAAALMPGYPEWGPTIIGAAEVPRIPPVAAVLLDAASITRASNAWVIGGSRTRSGRPILANDMHLALQSPSLWYLLSLHGGPYDVAGMSLPGVPFVVAGHNRAVAWGFTNASLDDVDFFRIRPDPADPARYLYGEGSERFRTVAETIRVRGADSVVARVRLTRHGPVMSLFDDAGSDELIALRWAAHDPSNSHVAIAAFNRAASVADMLRAIPLFDNPHQNVVFADTAGSIGYAMGGRIPIRGDGMPPPTLPVPGWTDEWEWRGYMGFDRHPAVLDPPSDHVVTANNRQAAGAQAEWISSDWEMPYRAMRILELIRAGGSFDAASVHAMQLDVVDPLAAQYRSRAVADARAAGLDANARTLETWDLRAATDSEAAALFYVWYEELRSRLRQDLYGSENGWLPRAAVNSALDAGGLPWKEDAGGSLLGGLSLAAALAADSIAGGRTWGQLHTTAADHALGSSAILQRLLRLHVGPAAAAGSPTTVNVSHYNGRSWPARAGAGASQRHVVDMGNIDGAGGFIIPTGQSGIPFHASYRDQWRRWLQGGLWPIPLDTVQAIRDASQLLVLQPARQ
jgi:penicillin G amidase